MGRSLSAFRLSRLLLQLNLVYMITSLTLCAPEGEVTVQISELCPFEILIVFFAIFMFVPTV